MVYTHFHSYFAVTGKTHDLEEERHKKIIQIKFMNHQKCMRGEAKQRKRTQLETKAYSKCVPFLVGDSNDYHSGTTNTQNTVLW